MHTILGLQETISYRGPWLARLYKPISRMAVRLIVSRWGSLIEGDQAEKKWATNRIVTAICAAYPVPVWAIQILVSVIIKWMLRHRHLGLDQTIAELKNRN